MLNCSILISCCAIGDLFVECSFCNRWHFKLKSSSVPAPSSPPTLPGPAPGVFLVIAVPWLRWTVGPGSLRSSTSQHRPQLKQLLEGRRGVHGKRSEVILFVFNMYLQQGGHRQTTDNLMKIETKPEKQNQKKKITFIINAVFPTSPK